MTPRWGPLGIGLVALSCSGRTETTGPGGAPTVEVAGVWHNCAARLELGSDGTFTLERLIPGCSESGSYTLSGDAITLAFAKSDCPEPTPELVAEVVRLPKRLHLIGAERTDSFHADSVPRRRYELTGKGTGPPANGKSVVRIVGDPASPPFSACYFSADGACGGFLSCGGSVEVWQLDAGVFVGKIGCGGSCPCAALLEGKEASDGRISGSFSGLDCSASYSGTFDLTPVSD